MKKTWLRCMGLLCFAAVGACALTGCDDGETTETNYSKIYITLDGSTSVFNTGDTGTVTVTDADGNTIAANGTITFSTNNSSVLSVNSLTGSFSCLQPGIADIVVSSTADVTVCDSVQVQVSGVGATGSYNYSNNSTADKIEILGELERYAQDTYLTGIPVCGNGSNVMYSDRVQIPVNEYITGYGFGVIDYGELNGTLSGLTDEEYPEYYHTYISEDPGTVADWNSNSTSTSTISGYFASGYYTTQLNSNKTDYEYTPLLAADSSYNTGDTWQALDASGGSSQTATKFRLYVKYGEKGGLQYATNSTNSDFSQYNGRYVQLDDYLTPFKILLTQQFNLFRGAEMIDESYARPIKGAADYWNASANGIDEAAFDSLVGITVGDTEDTDTDGVGYIEIEFSSAISVDTAQSNLNLDYWSPLPLEFFTESLAKYVTGTITSTNNVGQLYGGYTSDNSLTPVDTTLSLGPYVLSNYQANAQYVVLERNEYYPLTEDSYGNEMYKIPGIYIHIITALTSDPEAAFREFTSNRLDYVVIPATQLDTYATDPRTKSIPEDTTWKVNINATSEDLWLALFGEDGSVYKTSQSNYWEIKHIMSNTHFLDGLYYSIDRETFATSGNYTVSQNYLSDAYVFSGAGENGEDLVYNETEAHANAIKDRYPETYGYNLDAAKAMFRLAIEEEIEAGELEYGTASNPTIIELDAKWMTTSSMSTMGEPLTQYMMDAFNSVDSRIQLQINNSVAGATSDAMYDALETGQFDLGMGAITGMQSYPLEFMQVLCSDNRSGFVLNWSVDTSVNDGRLYYDGVTWSFDALWEAATGTLTNVVNGVSSAAPFYGEYSYTSTKSASDYSVTYSLSYTIILSSGVDVRSGYVSIIDAATRGQIMSLTSEQDSSILVDWTMNTTTSGSSTVASGVATVTIPQQFDFSYYMLGYTEYERYDYQATVQLYFQVADSNQGITYYYPVEFTRLGTYSYS